MNLIKKVFYGSKLNSLLLSAKEKYINEFHLGAINDYSSALEIDKKNAEALFNRGKIYFETDNFVDAHRDFLVLNDIDPNYEPKHDYYLAMTYEKIGDYEKASEFITKYFEQNKENNSTKYVVSKIKFLNGELDKSLDLSNELCGLFPENFNIRYLRAQINFSKNNFVEAILDVDKAIEISGINPNVFNLRGLINIKREKPDEALEDFDYALRLSPYNPVFLFNKAKLLINLNKLPEAESILDNILSIDDENKSARLLKAKIYIQQEKFDEALNIYNIELRENSENLELLKKKSVLQLKTNDLDGAKSTLLKISELDKTSSGSILKLADIEIKLENYKSALEYVNKALSIDKENLDIIMKKGMLEMELSKHEEAVSTFDEALLHNPTMENVRLFKVKSFLQQGNKEQAENELSIISDNTDELEYFIIKSKLNYENDNLLDAEEYLEKVYTQRDWDENLNLIRNVLKFENGKIDEIENLNVSPENKLEPRIVNALVDFEKGNYASTVSLLSKINEQEYSKKELIKPVLDFANYKLN